MPVSKYELLIRLAAEKCDDAAHAMNAARQRMETARQRLQQLAQFLADYLHRRIARGEQGMSSGQWVDYQQFIERLQEAIDLQRREVDSSQTAYDKATAAWQEARKKLKALENCKNRKNYALACAKPSESRNKPTNLPPGFSGSPEAASDATP